MGITDSLEQPDAARVSTTRIDRDLVARAVRRDHGAWEQIFRQVYPALAAFAARRVGPDSADDVVSETMSRAVSGIGRFRWTDAGLEPWLFAIARRVVVDQYRAAGRRRRSDAAGVGSPSPPGPLEQVELGEEHAQVRAAFEALPAADREILELRVIAGLTPDQVAAVVGKRSGAVRTAQTRALARLRKRLGSS